MMKDSVQEPRSPDMQVELSGMFQTQVRSQLNAAAWEIPADTMGIREKLLANPQKHVK